MIEKRNGEEAKTPIAYDDILREIGEFGAYQMLVGLTVGFVFAYGSFVTMNFVFSADTTEHRYDFTFLNRNWWHSGKPDFFAAICTNESRHHCEFVSSMTLSGAICRCWIPECEPSNALNFTADWLERAIPHKDGRPDPCSRYEFIGSADGTCNEQHFNRSRTVACDGFISKNNEQLLLAHVSLPARKIWPFRLHRPWIPQ